MRLQISVHRHTLPPTNFLFSTGAHASSHTSARTATISDLLLDVNDIVPLESEDGEWGLEDYVVEVAATADQDKIYEALHYQTIDSVLREDDEVNVRFLKSDELRGRRYGGRLQITGDGRHLVDGVVWGRKWLPNTASARPGVGIPPRKKRRVLVNEEDDSVLLVEADQPFLALNGVGEEDDEDEEEDDDKEYTEAGPDGQPQLKITGAFYDADDADEDDEAIDTNPELEDDEVQALLQDAAEVDDSNEAETGAVVERQLRYRGRLGKRKRDLDEESEDEVESTNLAHAAKAGTQIRVSFDLEGVKGDEPDKPSESESDSDNESESSSEDSGSESEDSDSSSDAGGKATRNSRRSSLSSSATSSSSASPSEPSSYSGSSATSEPDSNRQSKSKSKAASLRDTKALAEPDKEVRKVSAPGQGSKATHKKNQRKRQGKQLKQLQEAGILPSTATFQDLKAYQENLAADKDQTSADQDQLEAAKVQALAGVQQTEAVPEVDAQRVVTETVKPTGLAETSPVDTPSQATQESAMPPQPTTNSPSQRSRLDVAASRRLLFGSLGLRTPKSTEDEQALREKLAKATASAQPKKRNEPYASPSAVKTSVGSDDAWRSKVIVSAVECEREGVAMDAPPYPFEQQWMKKKKKRKLQHNDYEGELDYDDPQTSPKKSIPDMKIRNVCDATQRAKLVRLSTTLSNFTIRECYGALEAASWVYDDAISFLMDAEPSQVAGGKAQAQTPQSEELSNGSRTVSFAKEETDGMPIPTDFDTLADLELTQLLPGAVIAYKELHMGPETGFQPEISPYRVARIDEVINGDTLRLTLALKDRKKQTSHDPITGEVIQNNFEIEADQYSDDEDGVREIVMLDMMKPKLVQAPTQVSQSSAMEPRPAESFDGGHDTGTDLVPDSAPAAFTQDNAPVLAAEIEQVEINTPRRKEITTLIKEAGFDSAMNEQLLEPLVAEGEHYNASSQLEEELLSSSVPAFEAHEDTTDINIDGQAAPSIQITANDGSSSPLFPPQGSMQSIDHSTASPRLGIVEPTSSPPISPRLTVEYPHISQMELDSSFHVATESSKDSSSHQDAQRVPAAPTPVDITLSIAEEQKSDIADVPYSEPMDGLDSDTEFPPSQSQGQGSMEPLHVGDADDASTPRTSSFLGVRGVDGPESSPKHSSRQSHDDDANEYSDESGAPLGAQDDKEDIRAVHDSDESASGSEYSYNSSDSLPTFAETLAELTSSQRMKVTKKIPATRSTKAAGIMQPRTVPAKTHMSDNDKQYSISPSRRGRDASTSKVSQPALKKGKPSQGAKSKLTTKPADSLSSDDPDSDEDSPTAVKLSTSKATNAQTKIATKKSTVSLGLHGNISDFDSDLEPSDAFKVPSSSIDPLPLRSSTANPNIKISASQQPRLSQIPTGTQVVDLTVSSDPISPPNSDSDGEYANTGRGRWAGRKTMAGNRAKTAARSVSDLNGVGVGNGRGVGERRLLLAKKSRSQI